MVLIKLKFPLTRIQYDWIYKNVGPSKYYLHDRSGGIGWRYKRERSDFFGNEENILEFDDDRIATLWLLKWS